MPTFDEDTFNITKHSRDEIAQATCQLEIVYEIDVTFSFIPVIISIGFNSFWIFLITFIGGVVYDLMFVAMHRFIVLES